MQYFCPTCQEWHDVSEIAADFYDICSQTLIDNLQTEIADWARGADEPFIDRMAAIQRFLAPGNSAKYRKYMLFRPDDIIRRSIRKKWTKDSLSALFILDFNWVLEAYRKSGDEERDNRNSRENGGELIPLEQIDNQIRSTILFAMRMDFSFVRFSNDNLMIDYIGPGRAEPKYPEETLYTKTTRLRACHFCGRNLPEALGHAPETVIGLVGSPRAGKTSCVVAIASRLLSDTRGYKGLRIDLKAGDRQWQYLKEQIDRYEKGYIVKKTEELVTETPSFSLLVRVGNNLERVMTFVDMPGEFWEKGTGITDDFFEHYGKLYEGVDSIWFFISKLGVHMTDLSPEDANGGEITENVRLARETADSDETVRSSNSNNVSANLNFLQTHLNHHQKSLPPMAVIITKSEVLINAADPAADLGRMAKYGLFPVNNGRAMCNYKTNQAELDEIMWFDKQTKRYYLKERPFFERAMKIREYLMTEKSTLLRAIESNVDTRCFFSMAAYGHPAADLPAEKDNETSDRRTDFMVNMGSAIKSIHNSAQTGNFFSEADDLSSPKNSGTSSQPEITSFFNQETAGAVTLRKGIAPVEPTPYREMYPLLWTLAITGAMPVSHDVGYVSRNWYQRLLNSSSGNIIWDEKITLFDWRRPPREKKGTEDDCTIWQDLRNNLLLPGKPDTPRAFRRSRFSHERRD